MKFLFGNGFQVSSLFLLDVAIDIETTSLDDSGEIYSIGFSNEFGGVVYVLSDNNCEEIKTLLQWTLLNPKFENVIIFHNALFDVPFILRALFPHILEVSSLDFAKKLFDTVIAARYLYSTRFLSHLDLHKRMTYSLKFLVEYYGISDEMAYSYEDIVKGVKINFAEVHLVAEYNYKDCVNTLELYNKLRLVLDQEQSFAYYVGYHFPHAFWNILHMRFRGIPVNEKRLQDMTQLIENFVEDLSDEIYSKTKKRFNFGSLDEVGSAIFNNSSLLREDGEPFRPPFITEKESVKVDISTFEYLRDSSTSKMNFDLFNKIIAVMEGNSALRELNAISENLVSSLDGYYIYPNQTVSAKSGRIRMSKPNAHGQSKKCFKITRW